MSINKFPMFQFSWSPDPTKTLLTVDGKKLGIPVDKVIITACGGDPCVRVALEFVATVEMHAEQAEIVARYADTTEDEEPPKSR